MTITESAIRDRAYQIWEAEGRPHGQDRAHWAMAESDLTVEAAKRENLLAQQHLIQVAAVRAKPKRTRKVPGTVATPKRRKAEVRAN